MFFKSRACSTDLPVLRRSQTGHGRAGFGAAPSDGLLPPAAVTAGHLRDRPLFPPPEIAVCLFFFPFLLSQDLAPLPGC